MKNLVSDHRQNPKLLWKFIGPIFIADKKNDAVQRIVFFRSNQRGYARGVQGITAFATFFASFAAFFSLGVDEACFLVSLLLLVTLLMI
jgi:hypothetical protein